MPLSTFVLHVLYTLMFHKFNWNNEVCYRKKFYILIKIKRYDDFNFTYGSHESVGRYETHRYIYFINTYEHIQQKGDFL